MDYSSMWTFGMYDAAHRAAKRARVFGRAPLHRLVRHALAAAIAADPCLPSIYPAARRRAAELCAADAARCALRRR